LNYVIFICVKVLKHIILNTIANTLFIGKVLLHFPRLESTNLTAIDYLSKNTPSDGTTIYTYQQVGGRGQIGSKWESEPDKNVSLSSILFPDFLPSRRQFLLSQTVSLAIYDFLSTYITSNLRIKWPNDLYVGNKKIAGILIQNVLSGARLQSSVVGIGININQTAFLSDAPNPVSLSQLTGKAYHLDTMVEALCQAFDLRYRQLRAGKYDEIERSYLERLYRYGERAIFQRKNLGIFAGQITGIAPDGKLQIMTQKGLEAFALKEVSFVQ